jgi:serine/threonine-protein kinase
VELTEGLVIAHRFRLVRELGRGGMGCVWLAHHTSLDTPCAVKFINAEAAELPEIRSRFVREAKAAASLRSANVVNILDYGMSEVGPYIAMEYLEGEDLAQRLARRGRLTPPETVEVVSNVARALSKAHAAGLVHRDLKPENVFLQRDEDREIVKVLDFGIAKASHLTNADGTTKTGSLLGTPSYMSPEQAQGTKTVDHRSDLWSLAVLAFRCLTGRLPFVSEALGDLLVQIIVNPLPRATDLAPDLPASFDAWWAKAAARDPAQRFQSAREEADALAAAFGIATGGPPVAWDPRAGVAGPPSYQAYATPTGPTGAGYGGAMRIATPGGAQPPPGAYGAPPGYGAPIPGPAPMQQGQASGPPGPGLQAGYVPQATAGASAAPAYAGPSGSVPATSARMPSGSHPGSLAPITPMGGPIPSAEAWPGAPGAGGSGATGLGVSRTFGGAPAQATRGAGRVAAVVGGVAFLVGALVVGVMLTRKNAPADGAPASSATAAADVASAAAPGSPSAVPSASAAPAPSASAASSATATPTVAPSPKPTKNGNGGGRPALSAPPPASASAAPAHRPRLVLPGGKDPSLGF